MYNYKNQHRFIVVKVLIIDDKPEKYLAIKDFFLQAAGEFEIFWVKHFRQAQNNLRNINYDLVVLDMSFEVHGGDAEEARFADLAGLHVLQFMWRSRMKIPTIICTSHTKYADPDFGTIDGVEALRTYVRDVFGLSILGCVLMTVDETIWHSEMKEIIEHASL